MQFSYPAYHSFHLHVCMEMGCSLPRNQKVNLVIFATVKSRTAWNRWIAYGLYIIMPLPVFLILTYFNTCSLQENNIKHGDMVQWHGMSYSWSAFPMRVGRVLLGGPWRQRRFFSPRSFHMEKWGQMGPFIDDLPTKTGDFPIGIQRIPPKRWKIWLEITGKYINNILEAVFLPLGIPI